MEVCRIASTKDYIKAIELDIRKSKDEVLYCYHGSIFEYLVALKFPRPLSALKNRCGVSTLKDILAVISPDKVIALDIKDTKVTRQDILDAFAGREFQEVILCNKSVAYLRQFHDMHRMFVKMLNGNILSVFYNLQKLRADNFKYLEIVFPFLATKSILQKIEANGLQLVGFPYVIFLSEKSYLKAVKKYNVKYMPAYFHN